MGMKGISPVVAAVLLIAITVAVGVMVSSWVTQFITTRTRETSSACMTSTNYKIDSVEFAYSTNNTTIKITNLGQLGIYGFSVQVMNGTDVNVYNSSDPKIKMTPNITEDAPLEQQRSALIIINMDGSYHSNLGRTADQIKVLNKACPSFSAETLTIEKE